MTDLSDDKPATVETKFNPVWHALATVILLPVMLLIAAIQIAAVVVALAITFVVVVAALVFFAAMRAWDWITGDPTKGGAK